MDSLANRLPNLPLILAGPTLRRVADKSVTVWVALKHSANLTLEIRSGDPGAGVKIGGATATTIADGREHQPAGDGSGETLFGREEILLETYTSNIATPFEFACFIVRRECHE